MHYTKNMATDENAAERRYVTLRPRLQAAASLLNAADTLADIGCDHGKLGIALLQRGLIASVIGTDISEASLMKAQQLRGYAGLTDAMRLRQGDGLACIAPHEADALSICGMGGALIARIIAGAAIPLQGARYAVLQPMRGAEELRQYLFENGFLIET
ncbi:MAG: class I SAM-dependent methyltransferase, partial [Clostridiales bacterium]|nr:class I SAM-dependent methyltransferase [Clostridiales bacterium]